MNDFGCRSRSVTFTYSFTLLRDRSSCSSETRCTRASFWEIRLCSVVRGSIQCHSSLKTLKYGPHCFQCTNMELKPCSFQACVHKEVESRLPSKCERRQPRTQKKITKTCTDSRNISTENVQFHQKYHYIICGKRIDNRPIHFDLETSGILSEFDLSIKQLES